MSTQDDVRRIALSLPATTVDTQELAELITDSWCLQAPAARVEQLGGR